MKILILIFFIGYLKNNSKSKLLSILRLKQEYITNELIELFSKNYKLTEIDKKFLNEEYTLLIDKDFIQSKQAIIYNIVLIIMLSKLSINVISPILGTLKSRVFC